MELLTVKETAALLKLSMGVVRDMGRSGVLAEYRVGPNRGRVRFDKDEVLAHILGGRSRKAKAPDRVRRRPGRRLDGTPFRHI